MTAVTTDSTPLSSALSQKTYDRYDLSQLKLGPYLVADVYRRDWFNNAQIRPVTSIDHLEYQDRYQRFLKQSQFNQEVYDKPPVTEFRDHLVDIPAHMALSSSEIFLESADGLRGNTEAMTVLKVSDKSPWRIECQMQLENRLSQFLQALSQEGRRLLNQHGIKYGYYLDFAAQDNDGHLLVKLYGSEKLNQQLSQLIDQTITAVTIRPHAIWTSNGTYSTSQPRDYHLNMLVRLVGYYDSKTDYISYNI